MGYHMRKADREIKDHARLEDIVKNGKYAILALCRNDEPYAVTLSYGYDESNQTLYFHGAREGLKVDFIEANPKVCLTIIDDNGYIPNECGHSYRSVVIRGKMQVIKENDERVRGIEVLIGHFEKDTARMMAKVNPKSVSWDRTQMWKVLIEEITGKARDIVPHKN